MRVDYVQMLSLSPSPSPLFRPISEVVYEYPSYQTYSHFRIGLITYWQ